MLSILTTEKMKPAILRALAQDSGCEVQWLHTKEDLADIRGRLIAFNTGVIVPTSVLKQHASASISTPRALSPPAATRTIGRSIAGPKSTEPRPT